MAGSIGAAMRGRGIDRGTRDLVELALRVAMAPRIDLLPDDHHPAYLHPARSVLVLLHDVRTLEPAALTIAALHEAQDNRLRVDPQQLGELLDPAIAGLLERLPLPGHEALEERLVTLDHGPATAVLAERLDHLRHLHLRPELGDTWREVHSEVVRVWAPFADRIDERLAVRFGHWSRTFARRLS
jgi:hypothetical protein